MFDTFIRKFSKSKNTSKSNQDLSSASSARAKTNAPNSFVMIELFDYNKQTGNDEHVYEEIEEKYCDNHRMNARNCCYNTNNNSNQYFINEVMDTRMSNKKKSVRFNQFNQQQASLIVPVHVCTIPAIINCTCKSATGTNTSTYHNSILKKSKSNMEQGAYYQKCSPNQWNFDTLASINELGSTGSTSSASSSASSSLLFNPPYNNSLSSTTSSLNSNNSLVFNQMVEDFLNHVTNTSANQSINEPKFKQNSENKNPNNLSDKLSFRVTNLTLEDLKVRQKILKSATNTKISSKHNHCNLINNNLSKSMCLATSSSVSFTHS